MLYKSEKNNTEILRYLITDINAINSSGDTPLHEAVRHEQIIIIDFLLKNEADSSILNDLQMAPIHLAIDCDSLKSLEVYIII